MLTSLGSFGARARPFNTHLSESVLLIGLGQVGFQAVALMQEMLRHMLPPREISDSVRLLAIAERRSIQQEQLLPRDSRLLLTMESVRWSDVPGRYAAHGVARWWPRTPNNNELQDDPTQARPYGRLLLWNNAQMVGEKLYQWRNGCMFRLPVSSAPRRVFVIGSLAEAEGSGMMMDVIGRIEMLLREIPTKRIGVFTMGIESGAEQERLKAMAMVYAALKELDSVQLQPESYSHEFPFVGVAGSPSFSKALFPFGFNLLDGQHHAGHPSTCRSPCRVCHLMDGQFGTA